MTKYKTNPKGFTIIEVVLVLAIAGLIFLMVFVALPSLQRSQRDTQRRTDFSRLLSQVESYQSNNRNAIPSGTGAITGQLNAKKASLGSTVGDWSAFYKNYLLAGTDDFADPDGNPYNLNVLKCATSGTLAAGTACTSTVKDVASKAFPNDHNIYVVLNAACSGETAVASSGDRKIALVYKLEGGGVYCNNN